MQDGQRGSAVPIIIVITAGAILIGVGFYFLKGTEKNISAKATVRDAQSNISLENTSSSLVNADETQYESQTADWKTYSGGFSGFSFRFPSDFTAEPDATGKNVSFQSSLGKTIFSMTITSAKNKKLEDAYKDSQYYKDNPNSLVSVENLIIGGNSAVKAIFCIENASNPLCQNSSNTVAVVTVLHQETFYTFTGGTENINTLISNILQSIAFSPAPESPNQPAPATPSETETQTNYVFSPPLQVSNGSGTSKPFICFTFPSPNGDDEIVEICPGDH